ncbi:MAG: hypothetical protein Q7R60_01680, partial [bacterium]|nr:hypothetical protein [bacterium]
WILIHFTEDAATHTAEQLEEVRDKINERISSWIQDHRFVLVKGLKSRPEIALDIFWGPGHGCMTDPHGTITLSW